MIEMIAKVMHIAPLVMSGLFGKNDTNISVATSPTSMYVGTRFFTSVYSSAATGCLYFLNRIIITGTVARAPSSTAKKIPGLPWNTKKDEKSIFAYEASIIEVVSPTSVAAPWRFEETAIDSVIGTGDTSSLRQMASPTGATMSTVATLSTNAEINPENNDMKIMTIIMFLDLSRSMSASLFGILESIK